MLTGNALAILLCLVSGATNAFVKVRTPEPSHRRATILKLAADAPVEGTSLFSSGSPISDLKVGKGFLFVEGRYCSDATRLSWKEGRLAIEDPAASMMASEVSDSFNSDSMSDAFLDLASIGLDSGYEVSDQQLHTIATTLKYGGVVNIERHKAPFCADYYSGGFEVLEAINSAPGPEREAYLAEAVQEGVDISTPETQAWLSNYRPTTDLATRVDSLVTRTNEVEKSNLMSASAMQRFHNLSYPLTISAMMIFVVSIGSLLEARPQEMVAVAQNKTDVSINRFLWLIAGMSFIDLVWTLVAFQANQIAEVNPVGNVLLGNTARTIAFKGLATAMAIGILYKARESLFARKACWWVCLTLALLMGRWVLVSGVST